MVAGVHNSFVTYDCSCYCKAVWGPLVAGAAWRHSTINIAYPWYFNFVGTHNVAKFLCAAAMAVSKHAKGNRIQQPEEVKPSPYYGVLASAFDRWEIFPQKVHYWGSAPRGCQPLEPPGAATF